MYEEFKEFEKAGWEKLADSYFEVTHTSTSKAAETLLKFVGCEGDNATKIRLLDVACGPGYSAGLAVERGAVAFGLDFAAAMVEKASKLYPAAVFKEGDAENLPFENNSFDAVVCAFGLLHFAYPDNAIAEAFLVLKPGGRYAFTVWRSPEEVETFQIFRGAIAAHGSLDVPIPPGPDMFRLSRDGEAAGALASAGFSSISISNLSLTRQSSPDALLANLAKATVRTRALFDAQLEHAKPKIEAEIMKRAKELMEKQGGNILTLKMPALLAGGSKPS